MSMFLCLSLVLCMCASVKINQELGLKVEIGHELYVTLMASLLKPYLRRIRDHGRASPCWLPPW